LLHKTVLVNGSCFHLSTMWMNLHWLAEMCELQTRQSADPDPQDVLRT